MAQHFEKVLTMKIRTITMALASASLASCAGNPSPNHDAQFGQNARILRAQQLIDPDAPKRNSGRGTTDGKAMAGAHKNYVEGAGYVVKDGTTPPPQVIVVPTGNSK